MRTIKYAILSAFMVLTFAQAGEIGKTGEVGEAGEIGNFRTEQGEKGTSGEVIVLTKKDFLEKVFNYEKNKDKFVYEGSLPCIVDFYANWCPPCKMVDPILKDLAKEYKGKIIIYKVNIDDERELAKAFGINNIPTYFFMPVKGDPQRSQGAMPRENFVKVIEELLLKK